MPLSHADLHAIVSAASTLAERQCSGFIPDESQDAVRLLSPPYLRKDLPAWAELLQDIVQYIESTPAETYLGEQDQWYKTAAEKPSPFVELLLPFVIVGHQRYVEQSSPSYHLLTQEAHTSLKLHLLQALTSLAVQALYTEFSSQYRQQAQPLDEQGFYQQFLQQAARGGLASFLCSYSVLARLLATTVEAWIDNTYAFIRRLADDQELLQQQFADGQALGQVVALQPAFSNPHHGRRMAMALTFASGRKLVYKPRDIGMEASYFTLLAWCNEQGVEPPFKIVTVVPRGSYGWMEYVAHVECENERAGQNFYRRAGMLLCLAYMLGGKQCFYDHIVAHGEHPVLVDASALLQPFVNPEPREFLPGANWEEGTYSVLHTGLLASWDQLTPHDGSSRAGEMYMDISGFGRSKEAATLKFEGVHEYRPLQLKYGVVKMRERAHVPRYNGLPLRLEAYRDILATGFVDMYQWLMGKRETLLTPGSPLYAFRGRFARFVYRPDRAYHALFQQLLLAEHLCDGVQRQVLLESPRRHPIPVEYYLWGQGDLAHWLPVQCAEETALLRADMPFFTVPTDSTTLFLDEAQSIADCFYHSGFALVLERLRNFDIEDMRRQEGFLLGTLGEKRVARIYHIDGEERQGSPDLEREVLIRQALAIAERIAEQAIELPHGCITWLAPEYQMRSRRYQLQPVRYSLLNGLSGIALFLAATAKLSGNETYHRLAQGATLTLRQALQHEGETLAHEMGIGGTLGLGSLVYTLTRMAQFLDLPELYVVATQAASLVTRERIARDLALDVIAGSAGAILGLLALYEVSHDQEILERAILCARHLLRQRTASTVGCLAWPTLNKRHSTGFSHGTAGIVYALTRLYEVTHDPTLLEAGREALAYEDAAFLPTLDNWAEELVEEGAGEPVVLSTWCHGAPGIGLARLGGLGCLDNAQVRRDIEVALGTTQKAGIYGDDHICCGNFGRVEILWTAAQRLKRSDLADAALRQTKEILARAQRRGGLALNDLLPKWVPNPVFFHGTAGIGYTLLHLASPQELPSVLLWE
ncbi:hypothetical protein KSD_44980 [Ktedonobacter sp. SOSP1-85]|uniref:type 2 lanthipeptide synthetase LanM family protein n=1 Tax=Ktedonobacter sp. SOSP1-85 TaxID=2778367 RepID=UPI0019163A8A|nr:type 2 lanthipeptide synthetase LanM family protein [Ktedonobacter sp. SOSP1-85]GHO76727.1 hypothetical protein KSD_44980 [Ktedonobacter sp. SOSP1-85]